MGGADGMTTRSVGGTSGPGGAWKRAATKRAADGSERDACPGWLVGPAIWKTSAGQP